MKEEYLKTLWMLRFEKMRLNEEDAAWKYQEILDQCLMDFGRKDETVRLLAQLVKEERSHERLAVELIKICRRNHPDISALSL